MFMQAEHIIVQELRLKFFCFLLALFFGLPPGHSQFFHFWEHPYHIGSCFATAKPGAERAEMGPCVVCGTRCMVGYGGSEVCCGGVRCAKCVPTEIGACGYCGSKCYNMNGFYEYFEGVLFHSQRLHESGNQTNRSLICNTKEKRSL
jgi:hypothetical protein